MNNKRDILNIFISAPTDIEEERIIIKDVINDLNEAYEGSEYAYLELISLDSHVRSKISNENPQNIIYEQIKDNYDVFIGVLGERFGTPTERFNSGTEQEFYNALDVFDKYPDNIDILFYFSNKPANLQDIDHIQFKLVGDFKNKIKDKGLYKTYESDDDFRKLIKNDLRLLVQEKNRGKVEKIQKLTPEEDIGLFDLLESLLNSFENAKYDLNELTGDITSLAIKVENASNSSNLDNLHNMKIFSNMISSYLDEFSYSLDNHSKIIMGNFDTGINSFIRMVEIHGHYILQDDNQINTLNKSMDECLNEIDIAINSLNNDLVYPLDSLPAISNKFYKSKNKAIKSVKSLVKELENVKNLIIKSKNTLKQI